MQQDKLLLLPDVIIFAGVAALCFTEVKRAHLDPDAATSSAGTEMRRRIQILLGAANLTRSVCLILEATLCSSKQFLAEWNCAIARTLPDLVFLTTYSMLILFLAQLSHTATGTSFQILRPAFFVSNSLLYLGFSSVALLSSAVLPNIEVLDSLFWFVGSFYVLATIFLLRYGVRMMLIQSTHIPGPVLRRLLVLCIVCSITYIFHSLYFLGVASGHHIRSIGHLQRISASAFDTLLHPLLDLVPSLVILLTIHKKKGQPSPAIGYDNVPYTQIRSPTEKGMNVVHIPGVNAPAADSHYNSYGRIAREKGNGVMGVYLPSELMPINGYGAHQLSV